MKTIYMMRHSQALKCNNIENNDSLQLQNEKLALTVNGESIAKEKSQIEELQDFNIVFSSNYVRAIATAKYFTKDKVNVVESFGERKFGISKWEDLPENFEEKQSKDFDYKLDNGESLNEVLSRELVSLNKILNEYSNKKILIVGHSTAMVALFSNWCERQDNGTYKFNGKEFFDGKWNYCETFKLTFDDDNKLIDIENIK